MRLDGRSAASKTRRLRRSAASAAASILVHGLALALAMAIADPDPHHEEGSATIVVSLAERKSLGAVAAFQPASGARKSPQPAASPRTTTRRASEGVDPAELADHIPSSATTEDYRGDSPAQQPASAAPPSEPIRRDESQTGVDRAGKSAEEQPAGSTTARLSPSDAAGSSTEGSSGADGGSPVGSPGSGAAYDPAGAAAADFKRAFLERLAYPESARRAGATGTVGLLVRIDEAGRVAWARVRSSSGSSSLDRAALAAAKSISGVSPPGVPLSVTIQAVFAPASP